MEDAFKPNNAETTHSTTLTNVPICSMSELARIAPEDKVKILGVQANARPKKWSAASVPLFRGEVKGMDFYEALLDIINVGCVVDLTGSAMLAKTAMKMNIPYCGFPLNDLRQGWLLNVVDRYALRVRVNSSHPLYQQSLGEMVEAHFEDMLQDAKDDDADEENAFCDGDEV
jgi:hypothetical protein